MSMKNRVLVRLPANSVNQGLRINDRGAVDVERAKSQHADYCEELKKLGYSIDLVLPPDDRYPDSVFVEDPALIVGNTLVVTRLRRPERQGEEILMEETLSPHHRQVLRIMDPGFVEGGDVLVTNGFLYIGLSNRTNADGALQLGRIAWEQHRYRSAFIEIPDNHLHLKGELSYHPDSNMVTVSERLMPGFSKAQRSMGAQEKLVVIPAGDSAQRFGANCISHGQKMLIHGGCVEARRILEAEGFEVCEVLLDEYDKIDGAMTCMSKFF